MKFGPKQQERIEGWLHDTLRNYNYKPTKLTVVGAGVRYEATAEFTQKNNKNYEKFHKDFMRTLKEIAITKGKITSTAEIAKLWQKSEYYEQAKTGTVISFSNFEHKAEALLSRKPHEDVINFLRNIKGKVTINFDSFYETVLEELNEYYKSDEYEDELAYLRAKAQPKQISVTFSYNLNLDDFDINQYSSVYRYYDSTEEFVHANYDDLLLSITRRFPNNIDEQFKAIFNSKLKSMHNLKHPDEPLSSYKMYIRFDELQYFRLTVEFSDYLSSNQIDQLMAEVEPELKDIYLRAKYTDYTGNYNDIITFTYNYGTYSYVL